MASVQGKDAEVMAYIASYLIPFMGLDFSQVENIISIMVFFTILMVIYINSDLIHINPMLNMAGFHIYEVGTESGEVHTIISTKRRLFNGDKLRAVMVGDHLFLEKRGLF